jgi:nicotinamidase/pyrazinamidase
LDPQNDFHPTIDEPGDDGWKKPPGSMAVAGANQTALRIAKMIRDHGAKISNIFVTLDSHLRGHIAHARCWVDANGNHPPPFTQISHRDIWKDALDYEHKGLGTGMWAPAPSHSGMLAEKHPDGTWTPGGYDDRRWKATYAWALKYTLMLERDVNEMLTIWPEHCMIGTRGHAVVRPIDKALQEWTNMTGVPVTYILKGMNCRVESHGALRAEVADPLDASTALNEALMQTLKRADKVSHDLLCSEALYQIIRQL